MAGHVAVYRVRDVRVDATCRGFAVPVLVTSRGESPGAVEFRRVAGNFPRGFAMGWWVGHDLPQWGR